MSFRIKPRWIAIGIFMLAATINFLDRQLLAAAAPTIKAEFHLSNLQYGTLISAYSLVTAFVAPLAGLFVDRMGLDAGMCIAITLWSFAGMATGLTNSLRSLITCRMFLAAGESAGNLGAGKAGGMYLDPAELGLAGGFGSAAVALGSMAAPFIVGIFAPHYGWRAVFAGCGALGLFWVPIWLFTSRRVPPLVPATSPSRLPLGPLLRDRRLWAVTISYALSFTMYSLWSNWTTIYLVQARHLTAAEANVRFAWFPPAFAILGGFWGGGLAYRWIRGGLSGAEARLRSCWFTAPLMLSSAIVPLMPTAMLASVAIGVSFFCLQSLLANIHVLLIDLFGVTRAALTNSLSTSTSYLLQALMSPLIGLTVDRFGFSPICVLVSILPLLGLLGLQITLARNMLPVRLQGATPASV